MVRGRRAWRRLPLPVRAAGLALARACRVVPPIKVSIIIATYQTDPARLNRLVRSVAEQTMPADQIELVFVDDGSADDTVARLRRIARTRPHVLVRTIPNSGWPGRPRNIGVKLAHGAYLLFMDHDDVLYPRALERAYAYGRAHRADVVNAKEVRTSGWSWGWDAFTADIPRARGIDPNPLIPMTPHKLYRRRFVRRHRLRFREGPRVFWEDIYFNLAAFTRGARVAVLSSYPFYHWVSTGENNSSSYTRPDREFWTKLGDLLEFHDDELRGVDGGPEQVVHQIRARVLPFVGPRLLRVPNEDVPEMYASARALAVRYAPPGRDPALASVQRCQLELLREGDLQQQRRLAECDNGVTAVPVVDSVEWDGSELVISASTTLTDAAGSPVRLRRAGSGWMRALPADVAAVLSPEARTVTGDLSRASFVMSVKGRTTRSTWALPGVADVSCVDPDGSGGILRAHVVSRFDPAAFAVEHDLHSDAVFDFAARFEALGYVVHQALRGGATRPALVNGVAALAYENQSGALSLDVDAARSLTRMTRPDPTGASVKATPVADGKDVVVRLELPKVHCVGQTTFTGEVLAAGGIRTQAVLCSAGDRAVLTFRGLVPSGEHAISACFAGRTGATGLTLRVDHAGATLGAPGVGPASGT